MIVAPLADLAAAREYAASYPEIVPIVPGVTHCASCGFSYRTPRDVVAWRDRCGTLEMHPLTRQ